MLKFVALSSSRGTTFQAILDRIKDGSLNAICLGLVADKAERGCVEKAQAVNVPVQIVERIKGELREEYDKRLHATITSLCDGDTSDVYIAAVGWMWILSSWFVAQWKERIINVHPSLLPKYPGAHAHEDVLASEEKESGMTIHLIDDGVDTGKILLQKKCPVLPDDTPDTLKSRVQELEKKWYPEVLAMIDRGEIR